jgi:cysteine desulfurase family protein (TIGR01976 family)
VLRFGTTVWDGASLVYCVPEMGALDQDQRTRRDTLRSCFPALARRQAGLPVAFFDGPGGTHVPDQVIRAMTGYLVHHNANTHWPFATSVETDAAIWHAREAMADLFGATPGEIVFGANMTTLTLHLGRALGRGWGPGDEIVTTDLDHHANIDPWRALTRERGVTVRQAAMRPESGTIDWDDLARQVTPRTRLLAIGAASNALGTITDVARAAEIARGAGALVFVDAVHYAPHRLVDVQALGCDMLASSAYKFYGPHVGVLYCRRELLESLDAPKLAPAPDTAPERLETGTQNHEGIVGAGAAVEFLASLGDGPSRRAALTAAFEQLHTQGEHLLARMWEGLLRVPGVRLYGPPPGEPRTPTVAFTVTGHASEAVATSLAAGGVFVSNGSFYAATVLQRLGLEREGLVRAGCACYTTEDEVDRLIEGVERIVRAPESRQP